MSKSSNGIIDLGKDVDFGTGPEKAFARLKVIPLKNLVKAEWNYKEDDEEKAEKLLANVKKNGQFVNISVRLLKKGVWEVIDGNHRFDVLERAGYSRALAYDFGRISKARAMRIAIEVNETQFESNTIKLAGLLGELESEFGREQLLETMPYSVGEFEHFDDLRSFDWDFTPGDGNDTEPGFVNLYACIPEEAMPVFEAASEKILARLKAAGYDLHSKKAVRVGQVIELLAAEFVAGE